MYATVSELKSRINKTGTGDDFDLAGLLTSAADTIDRFCNRPNGFVADETASARIYTGSGGPIQTIDECTNITLVAVKDSASDTAYVSWAVSDWIAFGGGPKDPDFQPTVIGRPYTSLMIEPSGDHVIFTSGSYSSMRGFRPSHSVLRGVPTVQVTAEWGFSTTAPAAIKEANIVQAARWWKRGQSAWADTLASAEMGQLMYQKALDPAVEMMLVNGRFIKPPLG